MNRFFLAGLAILLLGAGQFASALTITDVGNVDTLRNYTYLENSSDANELAWVRLVLGSTNYDLTFKDDDVKNDWIKIENTTSIYAYSAKSEPDYFLIKTGNILGKKQPNTFLFTNYDSLEWAVINIKDLTLGQDVKVNIGKISHIDGFDQNQPVPEPASMLLLGSGLIGIAVRRKRFKK